MLQSSSNLSGAVANQSGAMEADTISKHGRNSKSQTSRGNILKMFFIFVIFSLILSCTQRSSKPSTSNETNTSDVTSNINEKLTTEVKSNPVIVDNEAKLLETIKKGDKSIIIPKGVTIRLNSTILLNREITIEGENNAVIEGNGKKRLFYVLPDGSLTIKNLTLVNGKAEEDDEGGFGGAIINIGWLIINDCVLKNNSAKYGGAIFNGKKDKPGGYMIIENTVLTANSSTIGGGAIFNASSRNLAVISHSSFENNTSYKGGAIYNISSLLTMSATLFDGNKAYDGGAIYRSDGILLIEGLSDKKSLFKDNLADNCGGAIFNSKGDLYLLRGYVLTGNSGRGGAVFNEESSSVYLLETVIKANKSDDVYNQGSGKVIMEKSTVEIKSGNNFSQGIVDLSRFTAPQK